MIASLDFGEKSAFSVSLLVGDPRDSAGTVISLAEQGYQVRTIRGKKSHSLSRLFNEFAAAFQFPWYFGENKDAFDECITDLSWLPPERGYACVILDAPELLSEEDGSALTWFLDTMRLTAEEWASDGSTSSDWSHPISFRLIAQSSKNSLDEFLGKWTSAGAKFDQI
jgi:hypothetical protein